VKTKSHLNHLKLSTQVKQLFGLTLLMEQVTIAAAIFTPSLSSSVSLSTKSAESESFMFLLSRVKITDTERLCSVPESTESSELNISEEKRMLRTLEEYPISLSLTQMIQKTTSKLESLFHQTDPPPKSKWMRLPLQEELDSEDAETNAKL
jgi:uncharacterized protein YpiB (UPF0302 family)